MADGGASGGGGGQTIGTVLVSLLGAGGLTALLNWANQRRVARREAERQDRLDAIESYRNLMTGLEKQVAAADQECHERIEAMRAEYREEGERLRAEVDALKMEMARERQRREMSERLGAGLRARLQVAELALAQARPGVGNGANEVLSWTDAYVVADQDGRIVNANPGLLHLLHWEPSEVIGRPLRWLVPEGRREAFDAEWKKLITGAATPDPERRRPSYALTKEGYEMPIWTRLHATSVEGKWFCCATMRFRPTEVEPEPVDPPVPTMGVPVPVVVVADKAKPPEATP